MKTPKIRFKGYTEDWEQRKLGEVLDVIKDGTHGTHQDAVDGPLLLSAKNIKNGTIIWDETDRKISEDEYEKIHSKFKLQKDDVLLTIVGSIGETAILKDILGITFQRSVAFLRPSKEVTSEFIYSEIQTPRFQKELDNRKSTSAQPGIYLGDLSEIPFTFTRTEEEQERIGDYFSKIDNLITLHQRKCKQIKKLKKFMLQNMFPKNGEYIPTIRFEGFTNDWEQRKLKDFGQATGGTSIESEFSDDGVYKVISIGSYSENSVYTDQGIRAIDSEKTRKRILNKGDLTMILNDKTASGNIIGRVLNIEESGVYVYNQRTERIEIDSSKYDSTYLYQMLNAPLIREKIIKQSQGNTQIYVNWPVIEMTEYLVPKIEEQRKVGTYFQQLDHLITLHQRKCDELQNLKKYMLQNMFI